MSYNNTNHISNISHFLGVGMKLWLLLFALLLFGLCFFVSCSREDEAASEGGTSVGFTLTGVGTDVIEETSTRAVLPDGTKVRVVVYKTGAQSNANYVTEKVYTVQADGNLSPEDGQPLYLIDGTYDFYTVTPDLAVTHTGNNPTVSVGHTYDYAVSLTVGKRVSKDVQQSSIALNELERKCAYLGFEAWLIDYISYVKTVDINEVTLTAMRHSPEVINGTDDFSAVGTNDYTLTAGKSFFSRKPGDERRSVGGFIVLPKTDGVFKLGMKVRFNDATTPTVFTATNIQSLSFVKGYKYTFSVKLTKGGPIALDLTVSPWNSIAWNEELGGNPSVTIHLGEWTQVTWEEELGGNPVTLVSVDGWTSFDWHAELGGNPETNIGIPVWTANYESRPVMGADDEMDNR